MYVTVNYRSFRHLREGQERRWCELEPYLPADPSPTEGLSHTSKTTGVG